MKENRDINRLFKLYLEGKANVQQKDILFQYLADSKNKDNEFYDLMKEAWQKEARQRDETPEAAAGLEQIWGKLQQKEEKKVQRYQVLKYAASIVFVLSSALGWYSYKNQQIQEMPIGMISKATQIGEKVKMILPDSSIVYLSGGSKLTWPSRFVKGSKRNIILAGEAFFEVKRDVSSPFIIHSGKMQTQVLGTSFNVYAYPADKEFSVAVKTGKVRVSENNGGKITRLSLLTPGMKLIYNAHNGKHAVNTERVEEVNSWVNNKFVFRDKSLAVILNQLERYYNVNFDLQNVKLGQCRFNATFYNKSIKDVMEQVRIMSGNHIKYKINNNNKKIALWGEGCQ
ncbi:FecR family protein [Pedobacter metabolipauper]|uniref:FecR family protein n=1 Tax=Pedobacter metabolipauper TaxID=425513 RepID=A0A4R6STU3_9SPHI|nr:FecR family protein [Pedobacter metabolipauper]TDQ07484.1 FecR family protein [Pedobacter metabolipauper]